MCCFIWQVTGKKIKKFKVNLLLLTPLIFFLPFSDLFSLPKLLWLSAVSLFMASRLMLAQDKRTLRFPLFGPIALFVLADLLSAKNMVNGYEWFFMFGVDLMGAVIFYYTVNFLRIENIESLGMDFVRVMVLVSVISIIAYYAGWPVSLSNFHQGKGGTIGNPNFAAILVVMALPIGFLRLTSRRWPWTIATTQDGPRTINTLQDGSVFAYLAVLAPSVAIVATLGWHLVVTGSKGAILSLGAVVCVWGTTLKGFERLALAVLGMFAVSILLVFQPRLSILTLEHRLAWWKGSLLMAEDYPVFGVGRGNWQLVYPMYAGAAGDKSMDQLEINMTPGKGDLLSKTFINAAHNDYLQILAEIGPLGLGTLLWFIYQLVPLREEFSQGPQGTILGIFLGWLSLLIGGLASLPLQMPELSAFFWFFSGILALNRLKSKPEDQGLPPITNPDRWLDRSVGY